MMSWSPEVFIGEMRPWPESVRVVRGRAGEEMWFFPERTCHIEHVKKGSLYNVWRFDCCGYEHAESVSERGIPGTACPKCGARVVYDD